jgi:hypothetical protein
MKYHIVVITLIATAAIGFIWWANASYLKASKKTIPTQNIVTTSTVPKEKVVTNFEECVSRGYPVTASNPAICRVPHGPTFSAGVPTVASAIRVVTPVPNTGISSPVTIAGEARGNWFFEATFPIVIEDANGLAIGQGFAEAQGDWMTNLMVPFAATVFFTLPLGVEQGNIVFKRDNPSGLPANEESVKIPIRFLKDNSDSGVTLTF